jgi:hypothetical protein
VKQVLTLVVKLQLFAEHQELIARTAQSFASAQQEHKSNQQP